jgi:dihydrofolate synthase/folylpolyglutamate synthase
VTLKLAGPSGDWRGYLDSLAAFGMRPGLERVEALLSAFDRPQDGFRSIHIVGTNGKSSTARYAAAICAAHGLRSAAYLSPHITGYGERLQVDGRPLAAEAFGHAVLRVREAVAALPRELGETTQFETLTVAALLAMAEADVAVAAVEAGLGGRLDATNVLRAPVVVLTNIGLEHTEVLGETRAAIFAEKAAVIKGGDAVFGALEGLEPAAERVCAAAGARAHVLGRGFDVMGRPSAFGVTTERARYDGFSVPTDAAYQVTNAALALEAAELLLGRLDPTRTRQALAATAVPGRLQVVTRHPLLLADGAHNADGMRALLASLGAMEFPRPRVAVIAVMRDKAYTEMLATIAPEVDVIVCTAASEPRSLGADDLAAAAAAAPTAHALRLETEPDAHIAVRRAQELAGSAGTVVVCGSLYLLEDLADMLAAGAA